MFLGGLRQAHRVPVPPGSQGSCRSVVTAAGFRCASHHPFLFRVLRAGLALRVHRSTGFGSPGAPVPSASGYLYFWVRCVVLGSDAGPIRTARRLWLWVTQECRVWGSKGQCALWGGDSALSRSSPMSISPQAGSRDVVGDQDPAGRTTRPPTLFGVLLIPGPFRFWITTEPVG